MPNPLEDEFWKDEEEILWGVVVSLLVGSYSDGVIGGIDILPDNIAPLVQPDFINDAAIEYAKQFRFDQVAGITDTSRKQVQRVLSDWIESGESLPALEAKLSPIFGDFRAKMIAQTETTRIFAEANEAAWKSTGFVSHKQWMTSRDDSVCVICGPLDGKIAATGNAFYSEIGGGFTSPPAHVNCRCFLTPVVDVDAAIEQIGASLV